MIQPKVKPKLKNLTLSIPEEDLASLDAYCHFLGGDTDRTYVITHALRQVIRRDKRFKRGSRGAASADRAVRELAKS